MTGHSGAYINPYINCLSVVTQLKEKRKREKPTQPLQWKLGKVHQAIKGTERISKQLGGEWI